MYVFRDNGNKNLTTNETTQSVNNNEKTLTGHNSKKYLNHVSVSRDETLTRLAGTDFTGKANFIPEKSESFPPGVCLDLHFFLIFFVSMS